MNCINLTNCCKFSQNKLIRHVEKSFRSSSWVVVVVAGAVGGLRRKRIKFTFTFKFTFSFGFSKCQQVTQNTHTRMLTRWAAEKIMTFRNASSNSCRSPSVALPRSLTRTMAVPSWATLLVSATAGFFGNAWARTHTATKTRTQPYSKECAARK